MSMLFMIIGSIAGTLLRYASSLALNACIPSLPLGTLLVNLVGGFLIGIMMGLSVHNIVIPESIRVGIVVGFLGSLTTFSSFSGEVMSLLIAQAYGKGLLLVMLHVCGSLLMTYSGLCLVKLLVR